MADDHSYWEWRDQLLMHPDGRANGGEPCIKCRKPVPPNAHWKHRDRHVCSPRCNHNLSREFGRLIAKRTPLRLGRPEPLANPRTDPAPRNFRHDPEPSSPFPFEFHGFGPCPGDVVERFGVLTSYQWLRPEELAHAPTHAPHGLHIAAHESGHFFAFAANEDGGPGDIIHGDFTATGTRCETFAPFGYHGAQFAWCTEHIRDLTPEGREYTWRAAVCLPSHLTHRSALWSPAFRSRSEQRQRISTSTAAHTRRVRLEGATIERFDPLEVFERDGWICQLCNTRVDRELPIPIHSGRASTTSFHSPLVALTAGRTRNWLIGSAT